MLIEERVNSTYKWVMLIVATIAQTTATLITYGVGVFALFLERRICTYEYGEWIISKCCKCWTVILYAFCRSAT